MTPSREVWDHARALVARRLGLDFPERRQADLERGLLQACGAASIPVAEGYLAWLAALPDESPEWKRLAGSLTVGETYFFRDSASFEVLEDQVLPSLIRARRAEGILRLRLWSAGCATGEEVYSLAILLDRPLPHRSDWALTILATDVNPDGLEAARRGVYREWSFRETPQWIRDRYFKRRGRGSFELDPRLRGMVTFAPLNLAEDGYPSTVTNTAAMDLILCRNVLMYFIREVQRAAVARLKRALVTGGWLLVAPAEASAQLFQPLVPVMFPGAIFYRRGPDLSPPGREDEAPVSPADTTPLLQRARALADSGALEEGRALCEAALARDRLDLEAHLLPAAPAHFLLGSLLLQRGERRRGRRHMEVAVDLLSPVPRDAIVPGSDGLTAGRLQETAHAYLESRG